MTETWLPVAGFEGLYEVSDLGNVRSLRSGKVLRSWATNEGYRQVHLYRGRREPFLVHRLVAAAFVEGDSTLGVNHRSGNRADNRAENLEWATCSENHRHAFRELGRTQPHAKPVVVQMAESRVDCPSVNAAAELLGTSTHVLTAALRANRKCKGYEVTYG